MHIEQETVDGKVEYLISPDFSGITERRCQGCETDKQFFDSIVNCIFDYLEIEEKLRCTTAD